MASTRRIFGIGLVAGMVVGAGTAAQERQPPPTYTVAQAPASFRPAVQRADMILRVAADRHAELIVMGVQGRGAADLMFFGSTTQHVVREATCPVLTLRRE